MAFEDPSEGEIISFVRDLIRATTANEVRWVQEDEDGRLFYISSGGGIVYVGNVGNEDHPFFLQIFDTDERKLYELRTEVAPFYSELEMLISQLFKAARGSIYDVRGTIKGIRDSLGI